MKAAGIPLVIALFFSLLFIACRDSQSVTDENQEIIGRNWSYVNKIRVPVTIEDPSLAYNIYINLRHTADYRYSNVFIRIHMSGPNGKESTERKEFKLAYPDGEWLGKGSDNMYSYQLPYKMNYRFPAKGKYIFELEQNMRDNPLKEITDAGLRVEKAR